MIIAIIFIKAIIAILYLIAIHIFYITVNGNMYTNYGELCIICLV